MGHNTATLLAFYYFRGFPANTQALLMTQQAAAQVCCLTAELLLSNSYSKSQCHLPLGFGKAFAYLVLSLLLSSALELACNWAYMIKVAHCGSLLILRQAGCQTPSTHDYYLHATVSWHPSIGNPLSRLGPVL